jgi:hypothetical protein
MGGVATTLVVVAVIVALNGRLMRGARKHL